MTFEFLLPVVSEDSCSFQALNFYLKHSFLREAWLYYLQPKMEKLYTVSKNKTRS